MTGQEREEKGPDKMGGMDVLVCGVWKSSFLPRSRQEDTIPQFSYKPAKETAHPISRSLNGRDGTCDDA